MTHETTNPLPFLSFLSEQMEAFKMNPNPETQEKLLTGMLAYQEAVDSGSIIIPKTLHEPSKPGNTIIEWYERLIFEVMALFKIKPTDDRLQAMRDVTDGYIGTLKMMKVSQ